MMRSAVMPARFAARLAEKMAEEREARVE